MRVVTVHELLVAWQTVLTNHLGNAVEALGFDLDPVTVWDQTPTLESLQSAKLPAGAFTSPGTVGQPVRRNDGQVDATWSLLVGVFERGTSHTDTSRRVRQRAAAIRAVTLANPTLGDKVTSMRWVGEKYRQTQVNSARTIGACELSIEVTARNVADLTPVPDEDTPVVESLHLDHVQNHLTTVRFL